MRQRRLDREGIDGEELAALAALVQAVRRDPAIGAAGRATGGLSHGKIRTKTMVILFSRRHGALHDYRHGLARKASPLAGFLVVFFVAMVGSPGSVQGQAFVKYRRKVQRNVDKAAVFAKVSR